MSQFDEESDFLDLFKSVLLTGKELAVPDQANKTFSGKLKFDKERVVDGFFEVGQSGFGSSIRNRSGSEAFKRETDHSEFIPLYFRLNLSGSDPTMGIFTLQSFDKTALKTVIDTTLQLKFKRAHPEYTLYLKRIITKGFAKQIFSKAPVKKVRFVQRTVKKDLSDKINPNSTNLQIEEGEVEFVVKTRGDNPFGLKSRIAEYFSDSRKIGDILEFQDINYDQVKVELEIDGKKRTINIQQPDNVNNTYDISDEVTLNTDNHPTLESIRKIASEYEGDITEVGT